MLKILRVAAELYDIERNLWTLMADIASLNAAPRNYRATCKTFGKGHRSL